MATPLKMGFLGHCQMVWVSEKSVVGAETGIDLSVNYMFFNNIQEIRFNLYP